MTFEREYTQEGGLVLKEIKGGSAFNVVPALASATLLCAPAEATRILEQYGEKDPKVRWEVIPEGLKVTAEGVQAHAASPEKGKMPLDGSWPPWGICPLLLISIRPWPSWGRKSGRKSMGNPWASAWKIRIPENCPSTWGLLPEMKGS